MLSTGRRMNDNKRDWLSYDSLEQRLQAKKPRDSSHPLPSLSVRKDDVAHSLA